MSPAKRLGYKQGDIFTLNEQMNDWVKGQRVVLYHDDHTDLLLFHPENNSSDRSYLFLNDVTPVNKSQIQVEVEVNKPMNNQQIAIETFRTMIERAKLYREGNSVSRSEFREGYGICDNVTLCIPQAYRNSHDTAMMYVKDNVIRQVPSFSGSYHYPVRAPGQENASIEEQRRQAERAYDNAGGDRWGGDYGAERLKQAEEILDFVTNRWDEKLVKNMTPAQRNGIVQMETILIERETGDYVVMHRDDESSNPYFIPYGETGTDNCRAIELSDLKIVRPEDVPYRSAASLINEINRRRIAREKVEAKAAALAAQIAEMKRESSTLEMALAIHHKARMIQK